MPVFEPEKSKIKMVILTQHPHPNPVWWSPIKENRCRSDCIIQKMLRRFEKNQLRKITNHLQFYQNNVLVYSKKMNLK